MKDKYEYIPGTCNIGPAEVKRRRNGTIFSAVLVIVMIVLFLVLDVARIWRLTLFIPAFSLGVSFQQWYFKFCIAFGTKGVFNFGEIGKTFTVEQKENVRKDRIKTLKMIGAGAVFGLIVPVLFYFLPI